MIVAIINQTSPVGIVPVEEFRQASDEATAVADFCADYSPPKNPADYLGYDSGWSQYQPPAPTYRWAYDFGSPGLVQQAITPTYDLKVLTEVVQAAIALGADAELGGVVAAPVLLSSDLTKLVVRATGLVKTSGTGASLVLKENGVAVSPVFPLPDTGSAWQAFAFNANVPPSTGLNVYTVWGQLGAAPTAEVKYVSIAALLLK